MVPLQSDQILAPITPAEASAASAALAATLPPMAAPTEFAPEAPAGDTPATNLSQLVSSIDSADLDDADTRCLANAVYFESRGESLPGQLAVAHVVINRAKSGRFPTTLCGVVHQPSQFSFVRRGKMPAVRNAVQWSNALAIAQIARDDSWQNRAPGALFFHARYVSPGWRKTRIAQIDNHIFYR